MEEFEWKVILYSMNGNADFSYCNNEENGKIIGLPDMTYESDNKHFNEYSCKNTLDKKAIMFIKKVEKYLLEKYDICVDFIGFDVQFYNEK